MNNEILKVIKQRDKYLSRKKDNPNDPYLERTHKLFRNRVTREIKKAKKKYYEEYFENNLNNMKKPGKALKRLST